MRFYLAVDCSKCDEENLFGPCLTTIESPDGLPVIPFDMSACESFACSNCGTVNYIGEFEVEHD